LDLLIACFCQKCDLANGSAMSFFQHLNGRRGRTSCLTSRAGSKPRADMLGSLDEFGQKALQTRICAYLMITVPHPSAGWILSASTRTRSAVGRLPVTVLTHCSQTSRPNPNTPRRLIPSPRPLVRPHRSRSRIQKEPSGYAGIHSAREDLDLKLKAA
jgi:hypothetical protein